MSNIHNKLTNDEQSTQSSAKHLIVLILYKHTKALGNLLANISNQGNLKCAHAAILSVSASPCQVGVVRVRRDSQNLSIDGLEVIVLLAK